MHQHARQRLWITSSVHWLPIAVIGLVFVLTAMLTWRKWPDALTDFGAQLYLPWQLASGKLLYRDAKYLTGGPLSQYYHAALFRIFGESLLTVVFSNLAITAALLLLIYRKFLAAADAWTATTICLAIVLVFAFNQYSDIANFNFITPYCHEIWHGVVLSILAIAFFSSWLINPQLKFALGSGMCAGLVFLTKPEVFAAMFLGLLAGVVVYCGMQRGMVILGKALGAFVLAALIPFLGFLFYFHSSQDWGGSLRSAAFAWVPLLSSDASNNVFYKWCLGTDAPRHHLWLMLLHFLVLGIVISLCALLFRRRMDNPANRLAAAGLVASLLAAASAFDWVDCGRSLPLLSIVLCGMIGLRLKKLRLEPPSSETSDAINKLVFPFLWGVFALALLAKLGFFSRIWHYGFALAMPAFASAIYLLLWQLPRMLERVGVNRMLFRTAIWLMLMMGVLRLFVQSQQIYRNKTVTVGNGSDRFLAFKADINPAGPAIQTALLWLAQNAPPDATLAVFPEGSMVNYLSRRANPAGYLVWNPVEMAVFGQENMRKNFQQNPPDFVMLIHRDTSEFGVKFFGQEERFGLELMRWIEQNYSKAYLVGREPLHTSEFGLKILKRNQALNQEHLL